VDDIEMKITHVIRGDDHLSNTPRQVLLYNALGREKELPKFAHVPMIMGSDGGRLSKRHGATSVLEYKDMGYLPEALVNYLVLLGWSTEDSQQIFANEELIEKFSLERCSKSKAIFDPQKLLWMNGEYIRKTGIKKIVEMARPWLEKEGISADTGYLEKVTMLEQEKIKLLSDIPHLIDFMIKDEIEYETDAVNKELKKDGAKQMLSDLKFELGKPDDFKEKNLEEIVRKYSQEKGLKTSQVFHPLRVAVSGRKQGPGLFAMLEVIGKERVLNRIENALKYC